MQLGVQLHRAGARTDLRLQLGFTNYNVQNHRSPALCSLFVAAVLLASTTPVCWYWALTTADRMEIVLEIQMASRSGRCLAGCTRHELSPQPSLVSSISRSCGPLSPQQPRYR